MSTNTITTGLPISTAVRNEQLQVSTIPAQWVVSGDSTTKSKVLGKTQDRLAYVALWECGSVNFKWHYAQDEAFVVLSGEAFMTDEQGREHRYGTGDVGFFPAGTTITWRIPDHLRKVAFVKEPVWPPFALLLKGWSKMLGVIGLSTKAAL